MSEDKLKQITRAEQIELLCTALATYQFSYKETRNDNPEAKSSMQAVIGNIEVAIAELCKGIIDENKIQDNDI